MRVGSPITPVSFAFIDSALHPASVYPAVTVPRVLFVTDNGHGLGHLTRLLAVARRARGRFQPVFLTLSEAYPVLRDAGVPVEYLPSYTKLKLARQEWQPIFAHRLLSILSHVQPRAVVVDHISPPPVIGDIRAESSGIEWIWSRRGMWRKGYNTQALALSPNFDTIVEPGDVAAPIDAGVTSFDRERVVVVPPVVLVAADEQVTRDDARATLGLPVDGRAVLIQLSDSDPEKLAALVSHVRDVVRGVGGDDISLFAPLHVLHRGRLPEVEGVVMRPVYPMARYLHAFDAVVSTAGYNSYHEVVASGIPAVFVARDTESLDDQRRRAEFGELCGRAFFAGSVFVPEFRMAVERVLAPGEAEIAKRVTEELGSFDGAGQFADMLARRVDERRWEQFRTPSETMDFGDGPGPSGSAVPNSEAEKVARVGFLGIGLALEALSQEVVRVSARLEASDDFMPVFLVDDVDPHVFDQHRFQFETVLSSTGWDGVGFTSYDAYLKHRLEGFPQTHRLSKVVDLASGSDLRAPTVVGQ